MDAGSGRPGRGLVISFDEQATACGAPPSLLPQNAEDSFHDFEEPKQLRRRTGEDGWFGKSRGLEPIRKLPNEPLRVQRAALFFKEISIGVLEKSALGLRRPTQFSRAKSR